MTKKQDSAAVLHVAPTPFFADRGCHIRIEGIVQSLGKLGLDNTICTYHHGRDLNGLNIRRISPIKQYTQTAAGPSKYKLWADWKLLWLCVSEYRKQQPDVIHAHLHEGLLIGLCLKVMFFWKRTPLLADIQGSLSGELETHGSFKKLPWLKWPTLQLEKLLLLCANKVVCSSNHSLSQIVNDFGMSSKRISLAQDGALSSQKPSEQEMDKLRSDIGLPKKNCTVVYSGALLAAKGLHELQELIHLCRDMNVHFLIIGYPVNDIQLFLNDHGLAQYCTLTGQLDFEQLHSYLHLADIAVDPKCSDAGEGSGKMLNYLACGLPVVAFNSKNNQDFLPKDTILSNSVIEMQQRIEQLVRNPKLRQEVAAANARKFHESHSWNITKEQLKPVYSELLSTSLD